VNALEEAALSIMKGLAEKAGIQIDGNEIALAGELIQSGVELLDSHAKKHAEAAGDAAAAAIKTEDQAEAELRKT
jgi:hypothetical protein